MINENPVVFDERRCELGEGPFWHPLRNQLFWFDIENRLLLSVDQSGLLEWSFDVPVSACGWISRDTLLVAGAGALLQFNIVSGCRERLVPFEPHLPHLRSNDGRADPWGGFWIGTMSLTGETHAGAIWRFFKGELRKIHSAMTIPNAICFAPDGGYAYFTDTPSRKVFRQRLSDSDGWPSGAPEIFIDLRAEQLNPDGAVIDALGRMWLALWGASRVSVYDRDGKLEGSLIVPAPHVTCPAFGGSRLSTLYVTTALEGMSTTERTASASAGMTFSVDAGASGQPEHQILF